MRVTGRRGALTYKFGLRSVAIVLAAGVVTLATTAATAPGTPASPGCVAPGSGTAPLPVTSGGLVRSVHLHVPSAARHGGPAPLVLALHGAGGNGEWMEAYAGLSRLSDQEGFIVAYPSAYGPRGRWNVAGAPGAAPDDVAFIRDVLDRLQQVLCVRTGSVYATGVSNGGGMVARLGCDLSDRLKAIAPVAGGYSTLPACNPAGPLSVLEIHGTRDRVVPYAGKGPTHAGNVPGFIRGWAHRDGCAPHAARSFRTARVARLRWAPCTPGVRVEHLQVLGGGHEWPGSDDPPLRRGERERERFSASREVWRFFASVPG